MVNPAIEARRQAYIERLYERSGRSCSTYSGLFLERIEYLIQEDMQRIIEGGDAIK
jgi:hypothetical protein